MMPQIASCMFVSMIDEDIRAAQTLPSEIYRDPAVFAKMKEGVFARSWQACPDAGGLPQTGDVSPVTLLPGCLDEPLLFTRDQAGVHCLSNVCTHRANIVAREPGNVQALTCRYHGRRFALDGRMLAMPEFEGARDFPSSRDNLPTVSFSRFAGVLFASLDPAVPFLTLLSGISDKLRDVPLDGMTYDPAAARDYTVRAHWALYCDNYLEGFHIPYVHPALSRGLDYAAYKTELCPWGSVQIGVAREGDDVFAGTQVAAYYVWLYPNTMLNFYPWGLSLNVVQPISVDETRVLFRSYVRDRARLGRGAGADLEKVEFEDEAVVEQVQRGVRSRLYRRGRYSPSRETGVHHFHRILSRELGF
jgi:choline monooxygenase